MVTSTSKAAKSSATARQMAYMLDCSVALKLGLPSALYGGVVMVEFDFSTFQPAPVVVWPSK